MKSQLNYNERFKIYQQNVFFEWVTHIKDAIFHHRDNILKITSWIHILPTDDSGGKKITECTLDKGRALVFLAVRLLFEEQVKLWRRTEKQASQKKEKAYSKRVHVLDVSKSND